MKKQLGLLPEIDLNIQVILLSLLKKQLRKQMKKATKDRKPGNILRKELKH